MDLIEDFVSATTHLRSPPIFRRWGAVGMVSAVLNRTVYTSIADGMDLWANMFVVLVGDPASGKTLPIKTVKKVMSRDGLNTEFGANSMTLEACIDDMAKVFKATDDDEVLPLSFALMNDELGSLFKEWKPWHIQTLASLWDMDDRTEVWKYHIKTGPKSILHNHYVTVLAGAQPTWLGRNLPHDFFSQGMGSRVLFVHSGQRMTIDDAGPYDPTALPKIGARLERLASVSGPVYFARDARDAFREWERAGKLPVPTDPLLAHYNERRQMHAGKLALIVAMARHPDMRTVMLDDVRRAWELLFEAEETMPEALAFAGSNPNFATEQRVAKFVRERYAAARLPVPEAEVLRLLGRDLPTNQVNHSLQQLIATRQIARVQGGFKPGGAA